MRRTFRQLASVQPRKYLEAGSPTGLTGLFTHPSPRTTLLYTYKATLDKVSQFPESSLYRQSIEALTKHRLSIIEAIEPEGLEEWKKRSAEVIKNNPGLFSADGRPGAPMTGRYTKVTTNSGESFIMEKEQKPFDDLRDEWDGEEDAGPQGTKNSLFINEVQSIKRKNNGAPLSEDQLAEAKATVEELIRLQGGLGDPKGKGNEVVLEREPQLTLAQIEEIENKIGAGLIEEVIEVAEGELKLTDVLLKAQVWEDLEEKPVEGQWTYFSRDSATPTTQSPPQK